MVDIRILTKPLFARGGFQQPSVEIRNSTVPTKMIGYTTETDNSTVPTMIVSTEMDNSAVG